VQYLQQVGRAELRRSTRRGDLLRQPHEFDFLPAGDLDHGLPRGKEKSEAAPFAIKNACRPTECNAAGPRILSNPGGCFLIPFPDFSERGQ
jgi:hypothetical protein